MWNHFIITLQNECFQPVCPLVCPCVRLCTNTSVFQSAGRDIKSRLVTALIVFVDL